MYLDFERYIPEYYKPGLAQPIVEQPRIGPVDVFTLQNSDEEEFLAPLKGKKVGLLGAGAQSMNHGRCLRHDGIDVTFIGRSLESESMKAAAAEGFPVITMDQLKDNTFDVLGIGIPDDRQVVVLPKILPDVPMETVLMFYHGMVPWYGLQGYYGDSVRLALQGRPMGIVAPKGPGNTVWYNKESGGGIACLFGAHEDSPYYDDVLLSARAYATSLGGLRGAMLPTTFQEETETDHFGEQGVLCPAVNYAVLFLTDVAQKDFNMSLAQAQQLAESEVVKFGHALRRGGARYVIDSASQRARGNMTHYASDFYGLDVTLDDLVHDELEETGAMLRKLQPHLSPVNPDGSLVCGDELEAPTPFSGSNSGAIAGILLAASAAQFELMRQAGYSAEGGQFEVQQEIPLITDCVMLGGLSLERMRVSHTAKHGSFVSGKGWYNSPGVSLHERFGTVLAKIQDGSYARQTKVDLVETEKGSDQDWLWKATQSVIESDVEAAGRKNRPAFRKNYQGTEVPTVVVELTGEPWGYRFVDKDGNRIAA